MKRYCDGGQGLLEAFNALDIDYVFTASGSEWAPYWEAVARNKDEGKDQPEYLDLWHETVAAGMAIGYALITRRLQAVLLHAGPGLLQGSVAVHGGLLANVPMLVFSSESITYGESGSVDPGSQWYRNLSVVGGPHMMAAPFTKWSNQVPGVETLYEMVIRAGELAQRANPGPVYLNMPVEVLLDEWTPPKFPHKAPAPAVKVSPQYEIDQLVDMLLGAQNPVILTETAGRDPEAFSALTALAETLGIPVVEPQSAVCGNFPRTHAMHMGGNADSFVNEDTDLVILVNCRSPWYPPSNKPPQAKTVVLDETPQRPQVVYQALFADMYLEGNVGMTLQSAVETLAKRDYDKAAVQARFDKYAARHQGYMQRLAEAEEKASDPEGLVDPIYLVKALRENCDGDAIFVDECITHARLMQTHLLLDEPSRYFYSQGGLGQGMGQALGVKLAAKDKMVVYTVGDGSFIYNPVVPALCASQDLDLPMLMIIFNNKKYRSMQLNHLRFYKDGVANGNNDWYGVNLETQPDLAEFAKPYEGFYTRTVSSNAELDAALKEAIATVKAGKTALLNVMVTQ